MAREVDYAKKIEALKEKVEKKSEQLKVLKAELKDLEEAVARQNMQDIASFIQEKKLDPAEVLKALNERFAE